MKDMLYGLIVFIMFCILNGALHRDEVKEHGFKPIIMET
jgi:hypothetical protein